MTVIEKKPSIPWTDEGEFGWVCSFIKENTGNTFGWSCSLLTNLQAHKARLERSSKEKPSLQLNPKTLEHSVPTTLIASPLEA